jgi:outer membrane receptor protein involved in Fe transport
MRQPWGKSESVSENFINDRYYMEKSNGRERTNAMKYIFGNLEASLEFDSLRLLSLGVNLMDGNWGFVSERSIEMSNNAGEMEYGYKTEGSGGYDYGNTGITLDYQRSTRKKGELITFSYRYYTSPDGNESFSYAKDITGTMPLYIRLNQWYDNSARTEEHTGQLDYTNPVTEKHSIEAGLKYILRQNISNVRQYELDAAGNWEMLPTNMNSDFKHISNIYAGYVGYAFKSKKVGFRTGLRAEGTKQDVEYKFAESNNFGTDYFNLVPSATLSYQLKPNQQLRLGYTLRIYRPSIWYLNPYVNDTDPYQISYGNPNLVPERSNSFNLNYSYFSQKYTINASASYSFVNNSIERYSFIDPAKPEVRQSTYDNIGSNKRGSAYLNAVWTPNPKFRINFNGGLYYVDLHSPELDISRQGVYGMSYINAQYTMPKDFRINAMVQYQGRFIMLQSEQSALYIAGLSASKDFLKKKMTVSLSSTNPYTKYLKINSKTSTAFYETKSKNYSPMQEVRLSISYRFGTMKEAIKKVQRGISNDDVKGGGGGEGGGGGTTGGSN